ncbi:bifunctional metallophosphatase/5'-nucleotidase [Flavobacterium salilacus subsp. salilacus]|uniref:bifunctional metallophosphatase/5'-nucleotidase n=1 Tax=Flavobacterium TaxID=237 RepID=UPI0010751048|nr:MULTISPECIES: 5'-nucleotidase C-terminal domain-containing protein [Flavobacterium]KAF2519141.1 bifunctional metallophosphatase/5'-nucleotidase [Flavobacterium salilacus subsp. salilacus]MBE1613320.1 5'-nucleotidase C-terminal domain-containing protein [Flavobacterium sp. SaA2.13]
MKKRRDFLKSMGLLGLGTAIAHPLSAYADIQESKSCEPNYSGIKHKNGKKQVISILQTTDVHCQVHPHDELFWENDDIVFRKTGGYANVAGMLKMLRDQNPNSYTIDTGDMFQGSELSVETTGRAFVPVLNAMDYDLYLPGNWEVVYGKKNMQDLMGSLTAPKICTNMYHDLGGGKKGELIFQPYQIWQVAGVKIGFLGYTDPLVPKRQSPIYSKGILYTPPEENLEHYVDVLKNQEKCAFIIVIAHLGLSQQIALANRAECEGVNYILGGDTHERVRKPIECRYAKVVEPGAFGSFIGKLDLTVENGKVTGDSYELMEVTASKIKPDTEVAKIVAENEKPYQDEINKVIGYSTIPLYRYFVVENPIDTLVLDGLKWKFKDVDIVLSNGFRFCPPNATPDHTGNIPITEGYLYDMLPVDSTVRTGKVTGTQLQKWLEKELNNVFAEKAEKRFGGWVVKFKGMEVTFNAFGREGKRVQSVKIGGKPLEPNTTYSVLACEREGDPEDMLCRMKNVKEAHNTAYTLHSALTEYLKANSPIMPVPEGNAVALDAPVTLLSQVTGVDYRFT